MRRLIQLSSVAVAANAVEVTPEALLASFKKKAHYTSKELDENRHTLGLLQAHFEEKMKKHQFSDVDKAKKDWHADVKSIKDKNDAIEKNLTPEKAMKMLGSDLSTDHDTIKALLQDSQPEGGSGGSGGREKKKESVKMQYLRAMDALNNMTLKIDDDRITTLTECTVRLYNQYRTLYQFWERISVHYGNINMYRVWEGVAYDQKETSQEKIEELNAEEESVLSQRRQDEKGLKKTVTGMQKGVDLYAFIMRRMQASCARQGLSTLQEPSFAQMSEKDKAECAKTCEQSPDSSNAVLLKIFSDPEVSAAAKDALDDKTLEVFHRHLANLEAAENEKVAPKYQKKSPSFLQTEHYPWAIVDQARPGCGCGSAPQGCRSLTTIIGQELECANGDLRGAKAKLEEHQEKTKDIKESFKKQRMGFQTAVNDKQTEIGTYQLAVRDLYHEVYAEWMGAMEHERETKHEKFECFVRISDLENNKYCAMKHIRNKMKQGAMRAWKLNSTEVQDCVYSDFMAPKGECPVQCYNTETLPDNLETMTWRRAPMQEYMTSPEIPVGSSIAIPCPYTIDMQLPCNNFICPTHCELAEWSEWGDCTSECDGGYKSRDRAVVTAPKWGGEPCQATKETVECNTESCKFDCELHSEFEETDGCLKSCTHDRDEAPRMEILRKHVIKAEEGVGTCPEYNSPERVQKRNCPQYQCERDMMCDEKMDLVILFECSTGTTRLGCWLISAFVQSLLEKVSTYSYGAPAVRVGLVRFGNGRSLPPAQKGGEYLVESAVPVHDLSDWIESVKDPLRAQSDALMSVGEAPLSIGQENQHRADTMYWDLGFNNLGQALLAGAEMLSSSHRSGDDDTIKKMLVVTAGKKVECTIAVREAKKLKENMKFKIDVILFASDYDPEATKYDALKQVASYPDDIHFMHAGPIHELNSPEIRDELVQKYIPTVCPHAVSPWHMHELACDNGYTLLREFTDCGTWDMMLCDYGHALSLQECTNQARDYHKNGFLWKEAEPGTESCNCKTHDSLGQEPQINEHGDEVDNTCDYKPEWVAEKDAGNYTGWQNQMENVWNHYSVEAGGCVPYTQAWVHAHYASHSPVGYYNSYEAYNE